MSQLAPFASFECLWFWIFYYFIAGIDFRRQILTSKAGPRAQRVNFLLLVKWN